MGRVKKTGPKFAEKKGDKKNVDTPVKDKGVQKKKPVKKTVAQANANARKAFGAGEITAAEAARKKDQDLRTLYLRFSGESLPKTQDEIKELHSDIKFVRTPRTSGKKGKENTSEFKYAFLEFTNEEECVKAKNKLATSRFKGSELYVDFVGDKSKSAKKGNTEKKNNPCRLFVCGLAPGVTKGALKDMFPKCSSAEIPSNSVKKGTPFGFVQFANPGDAKSAFDAAQNLDIAGHKITVLYAKISEDKAEVLERKKLKRKKDAEKKKAKKLRKEAAAAEKESSDEEQDDEDDDDEVVIKKQKVDLNDTADTVVQEEEEKDDEEENDDDDDDDDDDEDEGKDAVENEEDDDDDDDDEENVEAAGDDDGDDDDDDDDDDDE